MAGIQPRDGAILCPFLFSLGRLCHTCWFQPHVICTELSERATVGEMERATPGTRRSERREWPCCWGADQPAVCRLCWFNSQRPYLGSYAAQTEKVFKVVKAGMQVLARVTVRGSPSMFRSHGLFSPYYVNLRATTVPRSRPRFSPQVALTEEPTWARCPGDS